MRKSTTLLLLWIIFSASMISYLGYSYMVNPQPKTEVRLNVLCVFSSTSESLKTALTLDPSISVDFSHGIDNLNATTYDTLVLLDTPLYNENISKILTFLSNGGSVYFFLGPKTLAAASLSTFNITYNDVFSKNNADGITNPVDSNNPITQNIAWNSIPETKNFSIILPSNLQPDVNVILEEATSKYPILLEKEVLNGRILVYTAWLGDGYNREIKLWPYFNYFIYSSLMYLNGYAFLSYADWPYSPVPHRQEQLTIGIFVFIISVLVSIVFIYARKYSEQHPFTETYGASTNNSEKPSSEKEQILSNVWERIGLHRQLAGFFYTFFISLLLVIPYSFITSILFPRYIVPFPQAAGWYNWTSNFFLALWTFFDMGTSVALVKYFAEFRVHHPEIAIRYVQLFVWWQMLTGVIQLFFVGFLGAFYFSRTFLAHMTWVFIAHSIIQFPGCLFVFVYFFQALQRLDYNQVANLLYYGAFIYLGQAIAILYFRDWGAHNPIFGEALGAGIGYAVGQYTANWMLFFFTLYLYKKLGFSVKSVFRVDFSVEDVKRALFYGGKYTFGNIWVPLVWFFQMFLLSIWLLNYSAWVGYYSLAWGVANIVSLVSLFAGGFLSGVSESFSHGRIKLTEYYVSQSLKWANFFTFWLVSSLFAVGARFILGAAGPDWAPAIILLGPLLIFQLLGPYSWLGDQILAGVGRTGSLAVIWIMEQSIRAIFLVLFIPIYGMVGVVYAYIPGLVAKDIGAWILIRRYVAKPKPYWWQTFIAPGLSAIANYGWLELVSRNIWKNDIITSIVIFVLGIFLSLFVYSFIAGLLGAWDDKTLGELDLSTRIVKAVGIFSRFMYITARLGSKISPFHNKFPIDIFDEAMKEAESLTLEKKELKY